MSDFLSIGSSNGIKALISPIGASVASLYVSDKLGNIKDIVLGFDNADQYIDNKKYYGAAIGRYANIINFGCIRLNGTEIHLSQNYGCHHLHGGYNGFSSAYWENSSKTDNCIVFKKGFPDGENGYPGNLEVFLTYMINNDNRFIIKWNAMCDKDTIASFTNHSYFNLNGHDFLSLDGHFVKLNCDYYLPIDKEFIPTGEIRPVCNSNFDFKMGKNVLEDFYKEDEQLIIAGGYDHNFITAGSLEEITAEVFAPKSGIQMSIYTSMPGIQFYSDNDRSQTFGKTGVFYKGHGALCFETQNFPDAPNHNNFPSPVLRAGKEYFHITEYKFDIIAKNND